MSRLIYIQLQALAHASSEDSGISISYCVCLLTKRIRIVRESDYSPAAALSRSKNAKFKRYLALNSKDIEQEQNIDINQGP